MGAKYNLYLFCPEKKTLCRMQLCIRVLQQSNKPPKGWTHHLKAGPLMGVHPKDLPEMVYP